MSYSVTVAFKQIPKEESYAFIEKVIETVRDEKFILDYLKDMYVFTSLFRLSHTIKDWSSLGAVEEKVEEEIKQVVTFKVFYCDAINCLCFLMNYSKKFERVHKLFDTMIYFQNSCDQDYSYKTWKGIKVFEENANRIKALDWKGLYELCKRESLYYMTPDDEETLKEFKEGADLAYKKRSATYDANYKLIEDFIWGCGKGVIYIRPLNDFRDAWRIRQKYVKWFLDCQEPQIKKLLGITNYGYEDEEDE